ncbi:hypothetical protein GOV06_00100 [Candidatus Woesearchaeota archaeon]|nr:hypothetical protein [Candidatus Woesearchaeota archaeon]
MSKLNILSKKKKKVKKKKNLKNIVKSFVQHPLDTIKTEYEELIHPEVEQDIKEHVEEMKEEKEKPKPDVKDERIQGDDSSEDLAEEYEIPQEYAYKDKEHPTNKIAANVKEMAEGYSEEDSKPKIKDEYEPSEGIKNQYEEFEVKRLEKLGVLPGGLMKYLNPIRKRMKEILLGYKKN